MPGRICAVVGCNSSTYQMNKWMKEWCTVHSCNFGTSRCVCEPPFTLYPFPTERNNAEARKRWIINLNRKDQKTGKNWQPNRNDRICTFHFLEGKPTAANPDPVLKLGYTEKKAVKPQRRQILRQFSQNKAEKERTSSVSSEETVTPPKTETANDDSEHIMSYEHSYSKHEEPDCPRYIHVPSMDHPYAGQCSCGPECNCSGCQQKQDTINKLQAELDLLRFQLTQQRPHSGIHTKLTRTVLGSDQKTKLYTGLPNRDTFEALYHFLLPHARSLSYWNGQAKLISSKVKRKFKRTPKKFGPRRKLSVKDELLLTLMKLRLGLGNELLGDLFNISETVVSQVLNTWLKFLSSELKPLIYWAPKEVIQETLPSVYKSFSPNLRCIIDCTEVYIERPRDLAIQMQTWSDYKKNNTLKFLVAIAPNGAISYISEAYGGRASDRHIVMDSGFLNHIDPKDEIMADRGFPIQSDLVMRQAKLVIPPAAKGAEQMTKENVMKTKMVANLRIHVERAIGRIKVYQVLKQTLPLTLVPLANEIFTVCAALTNLAPSLVV